jgi:hypothetical protein
LGARGIHTEQGFGEIHASQAGRCAASNSCGGDCGQEAYKQVRLSLSRVLNRVILAKPRQPPQSAAEGQRQSWKIKWCKGVPARGQAVRDCEQAPRSAVHHTPCPASHALPKCKLRAQQRHLITCR